MCGNEHFVYVVALGACLYGFAYSRGLLSSATEGSDRHLISQLDFYL